jgi:outer membrane protein assembly factor BamB
MRYTLKHLACGLFLGSLIACSSQEVKTEDDQQSLSGPADLQSFDSRFDVDVVWRERIGNGAGRKNIRLIPAVDGDLVYAADYSGALYAFDLQDGDQQWSTDFEQPITSGVVVAGSDLYIATQDGILHSLNKSGELQWSQPLSSESIAPVAVDAKQVYVRTVDGHLTAFARADGKQNWTYEAALPVLTVHGTAAPVLVNEFVVSGFANGKLFALDRELGIPRWDIRLAIPEGRSELERLVDLDGTPLLDNDVIYATAYHGKLAAIAANGKPIWDNELSSYFGPAKGLGNIYVVTDQDHIQAYDQLNGASVWAAEEYAGRYLGAPVVYNNALAVTDFEGYLHLLSQVDGSTLGRIALRPKPLHITYPNQSEVNNWRPLRGKDFGIRSRLVPTSQGLLAYTNAGELILLTTQSTDKSTEN